MEQNNKNEYSQFIQLVESGSVSQVQLSDDHVQLVISKDSDLTEVENILYPEGRNANIPSVPAAGDSYIAVRVDDTSLVDR